MPISISNRSAASRGARKLISSVSSIVHSFGKIERRAPRIRQSVAVAKVWRDLFREEIHAVAVGRVEEPEREMPESHLDVVLQLVPNLVWRADHGDVGERSWGIGSLAIGEVAKLGVDLPLVRSEIEHVRQFGANGIL